MLHFACLAFALSLSSSSPRNTAVHINDVHHAHPSSNSNVNSQLMDPIINHPAISKLNLQSHPRRKLQDRHKELFLQKQQPDDIPGEDRNHHVSLFNKLSIVACQTGVVPRKELLETYAAALLIHTKFSPRIRRYADVAAGHGLLSWFLLVLDHEYDAMDGKSSNSTSSSSSSRSSSSAICIDRRMPRSADIIAKAMLEEYPYLKDKWCYVEADLNSIETHPSTLLVSVHACGSLSDKIIEMAIDGQAPIALVPCCHTIKEKKGYQPHPLTQMNATEVESLVERLMAENEHKTLGDIVDQIRCMTLEKAAYDIEKNRLPELFTKRNRLILAEKRRVAPTPTSSSPSREGTSTGNRTKNNVVGAGKQMPQIKLPIGDDERSRIICQEASGRKQSSARLIASIPRHFNPTYDVSIWLPDNQALTSARFVALEVLANHCCGKIQMEFLQALEEQEPMRILTTEIVYCTISRMGDPHVDAKSTGDTSQTYRFQYSNKLSLGEVPGRPPEPLDKKLTKAIHEELRQLLPAELGLSVR